VFLSADNWRSSVRHCFYSKIKKVMIANPSTSNVIRAGEEGSNPAARPMDLHRADHLSCSRSGGPAVRQAVLLLAGRGSRLEALTDQRPKCLVEINGKTILERMLDELAHQGIEEVLLVVGYRHQQIVEAVGHAHGPLHLRYIVNKDWHKGNNIVSMHLAHPFLEEDFLLLEGDVVVGRAALASLKDTNTMAVDRYRPYMDGTVVNVDAKGWVSAMYLKSDQARPADLSDCHKTVNLYCFDGQDYRRAILPRIESLVAAGQQHVFYEQAIAAAIYDGEIRLRAADFSHCPWAEIDDQKDLKYAEQLFRTRE
jgi:choline kinase